MTHGSSEVRVTRNAKREAARQKARALREAQQKKEKRGRLALQLGLIAGLIAVVTIVTLVIISANQPAGPGPRNMASDGISIGQDFKALQTAALAADADPIPNTRDEGSDVVDIQIYVDYLCPVCKLFEETNKEQMETWLSTGAATIEIHPISILDRLSQGTKYSTRAANAAACVADNSPDTYWDVNAALYANQPGEQTPGLSDDELVALVLGEKVSNKSDIEKCIRDGQFRSWVDAATARALAGPIPNAKIDDPTANKVTGTPTVLVNGLKYDGPIDDAAAFAAFVIQAAGAAFSEDSTPTPTPTPAP